MKKKKSTGKAALSPARQAARQEAMNRFALGVGYTIVGLSVVAGFVMSFYPQAFGMQDSNPAIGFGIAALAGFRLYALRREMRRQEREENQSSKDSAQPLAPKLAAPRAG